MNGEVYPAASEAIRDIAFKLSVTLNKPEEILSLLSNAAIKLSIAIDAHPKACNTSVRHATSGVIDTHVFPAGMLLSEGKRISAIFEIQGV